jgi:chromosome partitioning protein
VAGGVYAVANQKGGVGKTTTAVNLAACLAEAGEPTLVIDLDPQANATSGLGEHPFGSRHPPPNGATTGTSSYDLLDGAALAEAVHETRFSNLFLVPSRPELAGSAVALAQRDDGETYLDQALERAGERFTFTFVDCPPSLGPLTVNALAAADRVIVPVQCEYYALEGLAQLLYSIELVRARLNPRLSIAGMLLTMVDGRTRLAADVAAEIRSAFGDLVFDAVVPRSVRLAEAPSHGLPITAYDRASPGADAYYRVAGELIDRR